MNKLLKQIIISIIILLMIACESSNNKENSDSQNVSPDAYHNGNLINYDFLNHKMLHTKAINVNNTKLSLKSNDAGTDGIEDIFNIGALAYSSLSPLITVGSYINKVTKINALNQTLNSMMSSIQNLQNSVSMLESEINLSNLNFMIYIAAEAQSAEAVAYNNFNNAIGVITNPSTGIYYSFLEATGITNFSIPVNYQSLINNIGAINIKLSGQSDSFVNNINNISASQLPAMANIPVYQFIESINASYVEELYQKMQNYLYTASLPQFPTQGANIAPMLESYNNQIMYIYQIAAQNLQVAYTIDAAINQINYWQMQSSNPSGTPVNQLETNNNVYYHYTGLSIPSEVIAYNQAQQQLAYLYAARYNILYKTTLKYIISDLPFSNFTYPSLKTGNMEIDQFTANDSYQPNIALTTHTSQMHDSATSNQYFPTINTTGGAITSEGFIFYIYSGLNQFTQCQNAILQNTPLSTTNCPSIFSSYAIANTPGYYDGQSLQVYFMPSTTNQPVMSALTNLNNRCNVSDMTNSWNVGFAYVGFNNTAGFSCATDANNVMANPNQTFQPNWTYDVSSADPHATFTWQQRGVNFLWIQGQSGNPTLSGGNMSVDTAKYYTPWGFPFGINMNNYTSALVFNINNNNGRSFPFSCMSSDPLCFTYSGSSGGGICLGGQYLTMYQNGETKNIGYIQVNGSC